MSLVCCGPLPSFTTYFMVIFFWVYYDQDGDADGRSVTAGRLGDTESPGRRAALGEEAMGRNLVINAAVGHAGP